MASVAKRNALRTAAALVLCATAAPALEMPVFEPDDPSGRTSALEAVAGARTPESAIEVLRIAHQEAARWGVANQAATQAAATVQSDAWINVGPASADFTRVATFHKVDSGRPRSILVDPRDTNVVYVAMAGGGVWKTFNALAPISASSGPRWWPITESIGSLSIGALAMSPANPDSLLLGLGDPFAVKGPGLLHSDDGGINWSGDASGAPVVLSGTYLGFGDAIATSVHDIQYAPAGDVVLAATDAGLFRSTEGGVGTGWKLIDLDAAHHPQNCWSLAFLGTHSWLLTSVDLTVQQAGPLGRLWRSIDDGLSWTNVTSGLGVNAAADIARMTLAASAADRVTPDASRVYLLAQNGDETGQKDVFRSDDGGGAWAPLGMFKGSGKTPTNPNGHQPDLDVMHQQAFYNQMIIADPRDHDVVFVGGNLAMVRSRDGGTSWDVMADWLPIDTGRLGAQGLPLSMYVHADWHAAAIVNTGTSFAFYAGTDGGVFRSTDLLTAQAGQATWEDRLNRGIVSHLAYSVRTGAERAGNPSCTAGNVDVILGGLQDDGTRLRSPSSTPNWDPAVFNEVAGGDGDGHVVERLEPAKPFRDVAHLNAHTAPSLGLSSTYPLRASASLSCDGAYGASVVFMCRRIKTASFSWPQCPSKKHAMSRTCRGALPS